MGAQQMPIACSGFIVQSSISESMSTEDPNPTNESQWLSKMYNTTIAEMRNKVISLSRAYPGCDASYLN